MPATPCAAARSAKLGAAALSAEPAATSAAPALRRSRRPGAPGRQGEQDGGRAAGEARQRSELAGRRGRHAEIAGDSGSTGESTSSAAWETNRQRNSTGLGRVSRGIAAQQTGRPPTPGSSPVSAAPAAVCRPFTGVQPRAGDLPGHDDHHAPPGSQRHRHRAGLRHARRPQGAAGTRPLRVPRLQPLDQRHPLALDHPRLLGRRPGGHLPRGAVRGRRQRAAGPVRPQRGAEPGGVPPAWRWPAA